jgi:hypothetical protein
VVANGGVLCRSLQVFDATEGIQVDGFMRDI